MRLTQINFLQCTHLAQVSTSDIYAVSLAKETYDFLGDFFEEMPGLVSCLADAVEDNHALVDLVAGAVVLWDQRQQSTPDLATRVAGRDGKFGIQIESDWPQMGQIWDFLRSVSVEFGSPR